jgi:hypothetical protein
MFEETAPAELLTQDARAALALVAADSGQAAPDRIAAADQLAADDADQLAADDAARIAAAAAEAPAE